MGDHLMDAGPLLEDAKNLYSEVLGVLSRGLSIDFSPGTANTERFQDVPR
jgi:hypothetical protein